MPATLLLSIAAGVLLRIAIHVVDVSLPIPGLGPHRIADDASIDTPRPSDAAQAGSRALRTEDLVGEPPEILLPAEAHIVATSTHRDRDGLELFVTFRVALVLGDVLDFYQRELEQRGWYDVMSQRWEQGNGPLGLAGEVRVYCRGVDERGIQRLDRGIESGWLAIAATPLADGGSDVTLRLDTATAGPCDASAHSVQAQLGLLGSG
jgi:hypothetical protein